MVFKVEKLPEEKAGGKVGRVVVKLQSPREIGSYRSLRRLLFVGNSVPIPVFGILV